MRLGACCSLGRGPAAWVFAGLWLSLCPIWSCTRATPTANAPQQAPAAEYRGSLTGLVPAAGLSWMVVAKPKELLRDASLRQGIAQLFPDARLDVFARDSGVDLRTIDTGVVAGFGLGTLYLAEGVDVGAARSAFLNRLASEPLTRPLSGDVVHVTGIVGITPQSFVNASSSIAAVSVRDPTLTKICAAFALGKLKKSPSALSGAALRHLPASLATAPVQWYAPGPFSDEWARGAHGLLKDTLAVAVTGRVDSPGWLDVLVVLRGDYASDSEQSVQKALATFRELAGSALGRILSLDDPSLAPEIMATAREISLRVRLPIERLLAGLYGVVAANVWDLLDYSSRPRPSPAR
jgi:hypothetical protein